MIGIYSKLIIAAVIATTLAAGAYKAYHSGKKAVYADWNEAKLVQAHLALKASEEARIRERELQTNVDKAVKDGKVRERKLKVDAVAAAVAASSLQDATAAALFRAKDTHSACLITSTALGVVFGQCTKEYGSVAEDAGAWQNRAVELEQAWPKSKPAP